MFVRRAAREAIGTRCFSDKRSIINRTSPAILVRVLRRNVRVEKLRGRPGISGFASRPAESARHDRPSDRPWIWAQRRAASASPAGAETLPISTRRTMRIGETKPFLSLVLMQSLRLWVGCPPASVRGDGRSRWNRTAPRHTLPGDGPVVGVGNQARRSPGACPRIASTLGWWCRHHLQTSRLPHMAVGGPVLTGTPHTWCWVRESP